MYLTIPRLTRFAKQPAQFIARTVMVQDNNIDQAMKILNGIVANEGILKRWKLTRRYEKPTWFRNRINWEKAKAIYDEDMNSKLNFILKKNRIDPYPGIN